MKISIVGYANDSGLGCIVQNFIKNLGVSCQLIIPSDRKGMDLTKVAASYRVYKESNDATLFVQENKPDICIFIETPFQSDIIETIHREGIKTIFIPMLDQTGYKQLKQWCSLIDWWVCPNIFTLNNIPKANKIWLLIPVDTEIFYPDKLQHITSPFEITFLHVAGFGLLSGRKGTQELIKAFRLLENHPLHPRLLLRSILPYTGKIPNNITMMIGHMQSQRDLYKDGTIYIAPSHKEGCGLSHYEAMAYGLPILTTNAPPMNELIINENLAIPYSHRRNISGHAPICEINPQDLADCIVNVLNHWKDAASWQRRSIHLMTHKYSWKSLKPDWARFLQKVIES